MKKDNFFVDRYKRYIEPDIYLDPEYLKTISLILCECADEFCEKLESTINLGRFLLIWQFAMLMIWG